MGVSNAVIRPRELTSHRINRMITRTWMIVLIGCSIGSMLISQRIMPTTTRKTMRPMIVIGNYCQCFTTNAMIAAVARGTHSWTVHLILAVVLFQPAKSSLILFNCSTMESILRLSASCSLSV